ncbi:Carbohydrate binding domain CBM49 [Cynara cardunculus var. scolymus]|uniref:Endoglucanase n=1 Tax=Cynara cardunculus var. scolymus TaxID=59895 RepID=A0A103XS00_CYNCS|nr:Carbohydrate binding domain CBM49 [Cynara cardunculus var. scolymus]
MVNSRRVFAAFVLALTIIDAAFGFNFNYGDALDKSLLFFEAQRSGKLPGNQRVKWRGDSGLTDGYQQKVNLVGGYYDAGDHVKFGLPMAYSVTMLSWGAIEYGKSMMDLNQMGHVGDGDSDHYCWERAEDMTTPRTAYKLDTEHPGSDLAGETAAAMAAASLAFRPYNSSYSDLLLVHAKQLFWFADRFRGLFTDSILCAKEFYTSSGYSDELLWAATWLYRATKDESYLKYVVDNAATMGGTGWAVKEFSWDNKYAGVQILLSKVLMDGNGGAYTATLKQYQAKADYFASSAAFLLAVYSDYLSAAKSVLTCPDGNADYILGKNPKSMSYIVGYGQNYPIHVHHRGASIASISTLHSVVGCVQGFDAWYHRPEANPNIVHGGLVGGPDKNDNFDDDHPHPKTAAKPYEKPGMPVEFFHSITDSWTVGRIAYYRHKVTIKNKSEKPITDLKLAIENLSGSLWGLSPTQNKNIYELPEWIKVIKPGSECSFVYVQGGPQAKVSVQSYH